jgi:hypothetical protein
MNPNERDPRVYSDDAYRDYPTRIDMELSQSELHKFYRSEQQRRVKVE